VPFPASSNPFPCISGRKRDENTRNVEAVFRPGNPRTGSFIFQLNPVTGNKSNPSGSCPETGYLDPDTRNCSYGNQRKTTESRYLPTFPARNGGNSKENSIGHQIKSGHKFPSMNHFFQSVPIKSVATLTFRSNPVISITQKQEIHILHNI
jgi:hypothetical protein